MTEKNNFALKKYCAVNIKEAEWVFSENYWKQWKAPVTTMGKNRLSINDIVKTGYSHTVE